MEDVIWREIDTSNR